jgi:hypothetical protein
MWGKIGAVCALLSVTIVGLPLAASALSLNTAVSCANGVSRGEYLATSVVAGDTLTFIFDPAACNFVTRYDSSIRITSGTTGILGTTPEGRTVYTLDESGVLVVEVTETPSLGRTLLNFQFQNTGAPGFFSSDFSFIYQSLSASNRTGAPDSSVVLPPVEHSLGFDANGGDCTLTNSGPIIDGVWIKVPTAEQCSRLGYTLLGWNPKPDGSDPLGFDPGGFTLMTDDNTLYAIWVPVS